MSENARNAKDYVIVMVMDDSYGLFIVKNVPEAPKRPDVMFINITRDFDI